MQLNYTGWEITLSICIGFYANCVINNFAVGFGFQMSSIL